MAQPTIVVVNPASGTANYHGAEFIAGLGYPGHVSVADLTSVTVAALVPSDWKVSVIDEGIDPVDFTNVPDFVAITGKASQRDRMITLADEYRRRGSTVLMGGPYATLYTEAVRPHADIVVLGEIEEIAAGLFADLKQGRWRDVYVGTKPDLRLSPLPRWDLYPNKRAVLGSVQTSRGCPFDCEFCDVIQYLGRKQRHKEPEQVIRELDVLYRNGYREVFMADDNFTVYRKRASDLLAAIKTWNDAHSHDRMRFATQASIDVARDDDLLDQCRDAGLDTVFFGIETVNEESLRETHKRQNLLQNMEGALANILGHGIAALGGFIVGFDNDGPDIFDLQYEFIQRSGLVDLTVGLLVAPNGTPLYARLRREGRLREDDLSMPNLWHTNVVPLGMTHEQLIDGHDKLCRRLYSPEAFQERVDRFLDKFGTQLPRKPAVKDYPTGDFSGVAMQKIAEMGPRDAAMVHYVRARLRERPDAHKAFKFFMIRYAQARYMLSQKDKWAVPA